MILLLFASTFLVFHVLRLLLSRNFFQILVISIFVVLSLIFFPASTPLQCAVFFQKIYFLTCFLDIQESGKLTKEEKPEKKDIVTALTYDDIPTPPGDKKGNFFGILHFVLKKNPGMIYFYAASHIYAQFSD